MHLQVNIPDNGRKNIFKDKQTAKNVPLIFLDLNVLMETQILWFWNLPTNRKGAVYLFSA